jgi:hypothetical protein
MPLEEDIPTLEKWADMLRSVDYKGSLSLEGIFGTDLKADIEATYNKLTPFRML